MLLQLLIIDDDSADALLLRARVSLLGRDPVVVVHAANLSEARDALRENDFDLIFLDVRMGPESGLDFLEELAGQDDVPPVVVSSGVLDPETVEIAARYGARWISKDDLTTEAVERILRELKESAA